jgi:hypothetical protein
METSFQSEKSQPSGEEQQAIGSPLGDDPLESTSRSEFPPEDPNIVDFHGTNDPEDPQNWSNTYKYIIVGLLSAMQLMV